MTVRIERNPSNVGGYASQLCQNGHPGLTRDADTDMPIDRASHHIHLLTLLIASLVSSACREAPGPTESDEYIQNPNPESIDPFCRWQEEPTPPDGMVVHRIGAGLPLDNDHNSCSDFEPEEVDALLIEEYENNVDDDCDPEPFELLRGCYDTPVGGVRCIFSAYVFSPCPLSTSK